MSSASPTPPRVLLVRFSSIGDVLLTTPLLRALRRRHAGAHIAYLTKREHAPLVRHHPAVDRVIELAPGGSLAALAAEVRAHGYTHLLDLHGSLRTRALRWLVPGAWSGYPKHRLARLALVRTKRNRYPKDTPPVAERYFRAAAALGAVPDGEPPELALPEAARTRVRAWLAERGLPDRGMVVIAPGAAHATKRWPLEHWQALVRSLSAEGRTVVSVGGPDDVALAEAAVTPAGLGGASAAGAFGLLETGALVERAALVASGDTGVMHMATAVGTPVAALFGPTVRAFGFFPYTGAATVLERDLPCRPCSTMGSATCPLGHHRCLREIAPESVLAALHGLAR